MTSKEIIKKAIRLEPTPRVPVMIISGGLWTFTQCGISLQESLDADPETTADYMIQTNEKVRSDVIWSGAGLSHIVLRALGAKTDFSVFGKAGSVQPLISSPGDVDRLNIDWIKEDPGIISMVETAKVLKKRIGDTYTQGVIAWGPLTLASQLLGASDFLRGTCKDKKGMHYIMDFTQEATLAYFKLFADAGVELFALGEPVCSCDMISPKIFKDLALPHLQYVNQKVKEAGGSTMLHVCGKSEPLFDLLPETGTDVFSMDWKCSLALAREKLGGKIAFVGHVNPANVMLMGSDDEVRQACEDCVKDAQWEKGGYILAPGCDIAPDTPLSHLNIMMDVAYSNTQNI